MRPHATRPRPARRDPPGPARRSSCGASRACGSAECAVGRSRLPYSARVTIELCAAEGAALEVVADRIGRELGLRRQRLVAEGLGLAGRAVAVVVGGVIVPPAALVVGAAVKD